MPFCTVKCGYCDFNSYAELEDLIPAWEAALREELKRWAPAVGGRPLVTVFIGGGTPSLLAGEVVARIMEAIRASYAVEPGAEVTLEANPESVRRERLRAYRAAGVNRLSIGVQSLDAAELRFLDRAHDAEGAAAAVALAREAGFENVNLDLLCGLPGQSLASWQRTLEGALAWEPEHLSCYALTVEEGTPLAAHVARGQVSEVDPDLVATMTEWTEQRLARAGYEQYEINHYARPGSACRHNLVYWRQGEYVAVGPGAHGFVDGVRYSVERSPTRYLAAMERSEGALGLPTPAAVTREEEDAATAALDAAVLGLRLNEGIDADAMAAAYPEAWPRLQPGLDWGEETRLLERDGDRRRLTPRGRRLANELFVRLLEPSLV